MSQMRFVSNAPWPKDEVEKLRLWRAAGIGNAEVARRLGRTVHSVTAKVRKLRLPVLVPRPAEAEAPKPRVHAAPEVPRAGKHTLPPLRSLSE